MSLPNPSPRSDTEYDALQQAEQERHEAQWRDRVKVLWLAAKVPARHSRPFEPDPESPWAEALARYNTASADLTLLCGNRGSGKTQLACKVIASVCRGGLSARYTTAIEIFLDLRGAMKADDTDERAVLEHFTRPDLLVIDDVHERGESEWENRMMFHLIDRRYRECRATILITNQTKAEAIKSLGPSIVDRLRESGGVIECNWPSFRARPQ